MEVVLLFPGQGSQKPGMGEDLYEAYPEARAVFDRVDHVLGTGLSQLCFKGPAEELTLTQNAQPALLAHGAAIWAVIKRRLIGSVRAAAGHSLGEFSAYLAADSMTLDDAAILVRNRGELMYESGLRRPGAMAAILGELLHPIEEICARASSEAALVTPANFNCPGQVVISGETAGVERAMQLAKDAGAKRAVRLKVSGAFHSPLMADASDGLRAALDHLTLSDPAFPVYANVTAEPVLGSSRARTLLLDQLTRPVRWMDEVEAMWKQWPNALFVELGPGNVLTGLVRKTVASARVAACGSVAEVEQLLELAGA